MHNKSTLKIILSFLFIFNIYPLAIYIIFRQIAILLPWIPSYLPWTPKNIIISKIKLIFATRFNSFLFEMYHQTLFTNNNLLYTDSKYSSNPSKTVLNPIPFLNPFPLLLWHSPLTTTIFIYHPTHPYLFLHFYLLYHLIFYFKNLLPKNSAKQSKIQKITSHILFCDWWFSIFLLLQVHFFNKR